MDGQDRSMPRSLLSCLLVVGVSLAAAACFSGGGGHAAPPPVMIPETLAIERPPTLHPGGTAQLRVLLVRPDRTGQDLTAGARWQTSNPAVATVSAAGVATAVGPGTCTITARAGGRDATAQLTVER
jgi:Bacterial Ig-like domain (group 2)